MAVNESYPLALPAGSVLAGRYIIEKVLGQGGFGITYKAKDHVTGSFVAVKEFFPDTLAYRERSTVYSYSGERSENFEYGKSNFLDEAKTLAQFIGNDNIVRIYTYFEENGTAYFVMEYIEGVSFDTYLKQKGRRISVKEAEEILIPVMDALGAVHSKGIVHRDVTPDNIYICNNGTVKLLDFGAARYSLGDKSRSLDVILKHGFAPKEQYTRRGKQGPFTDIYSLGATFYFAITGKRPPDSVDRLEEDELVPPSALGVDITEYQERAILQALEVQPQSRFQSMEVFKKVLINESRAAEDSSRTMQLTNNFIEFSQEPAQQNVQQPYQVQQPVQQSYPAQQPIQQPYQVQQPVQQTYPVQQPYQAQQPVQQQYAAQQYYNQPAYSGKNEDNGKNKKPIVIISIIAAVLVVGIVIVCVLVFGNSEKSNKTADNSGSTKKSKDIDDDEPSDTVTKVPDNTVTDAPITDGPITAVPATEAPAITDAPSYSKAYPNVYGNTAANINIGAWVTYDETEDVFFYTINDSIYKTQNGEEDLTWDTLSSSALYFDNVCYYSGLLLYVEKGEDSGKIKTADTSDINSTGYDTWFTDYTNVESFYWTDDYFIIYDYNTLYKLNSYDGKVAEKINIPNDFCVYGDYLYYADADASPATINRLALDNFSNKKTLECNNSGYCHELIITPDGYMLTVFTDNNNSLKNEILRIDLSSFDKNKEIGESYSISAPVTDRDIYVFDITGYKNQVFYLVGYYDNSNNWTNRLYHMELSSDYSYATRTDEIMKSGNAYCPNLILFEDEMALYWLYYDDDGYENIDSEWYEY